MKNQPLPIVSRIASMSTKKTNKPIDKTELHPRNKHRQGYDFDRLIRSYPLLAKHLHINDYQNTSLNFFDPAAVKALNKALLLSHYGLEYWDIPDGYLCPAVPGRADYIHHLADLVQLNHGQKNTTTKSQINCLDVGTGANCIYAIIGAREYGWSFVGTDIDRDALQSADKIVSSNATLAGRIELRHQDNSEHIFKGIIRDSDYFDFCLCNPPFHSSAAEAAQAANRKLKNLGQKSHDDAVLNFGGNNHELWCEGGELEFITQMINESVLFSTSCFWFTTLVSKHEHLDSLSKTLESKHPTSVKTIPMGQGQKKSRILAWTFLSEKQQRIWASTRWI